MIKRLFSKKNDDSLSQNTVRLDLDSFIERFKAANVFDSATNDMVTDCILSGKKQITLTKDKLEELESKLKKQKDFDKKITDTATLNNNGIALEKAGDIDSAIKAYEQNISQRHPATHSYDRLMILYRKRKDFANEIRVIKVALEVFTQENERRLKRALSETTNQDEKQAIIIAHEDCESIKGKDGWVIYNPYPVKKFKSRLLKAIDLQEKTK